MDGYAFLTEWLFWVFETIPMIGAIGVFVIYHPSRFLGSDGAAPERTERRRWCCWGRRKIEVSKA